MHYLEVALLVEKEVLGLEVSVGDALRVEVLDALEDLFEATLYLAGTHAAASDRRIEITTRTVLHDFAPVLILVLDKINSLDNVRVVEGGGNAEFGSEFLDILFFCLILAAFAELLERNEQGSRTIKKTTDLDSVEFLLCAIPLVSELDDRSSTLADRDTLTGTIVLELTTAGHRSGRLATMFRSSIGFAATTGRGLATLLGSRGEKILEVELVTVRLTGHGRGTRPYTRTNLA